MTTKTLLVWLSIVGVLLALMFAGRTEADGTESRIALKLGYDIHHQAFAASQAHRRPPLPWFGCTGSRICYSLAQWCHMHQTKDFQCDPERYSRNYR